MLTLPQSPNHGTEALPSQPFDSLAQLQQLQQNAILSQLHKNEILTSPTVKQPRFDRSISEPYGSNDIALRRHQSDKKILNPIRYKTEMCRPFVENGYCKYGDKCQFAHGSLERRAVPRHPKYKTEYCKTFHTSGLCPYGPRCHFIHNEDEEKLNEIIKMKQQQATVQAAKEMVKQAANIQMQHQLIQNQLHTLVSQINYQLVSQINVPSGPQATVGQQVRPRLMHSISVHPTLQTSHSLGSTADTPPESMNSSPILSPTFTHSDDSVSDSLSDTLSSRGLSPPARHEVPTAGFAFPTNEASLPTLHEQDIMPSQSDNLTPSIIASLSRSVQNLHLRQSHSIQRDIHATGIRPGRAIVAANHLQTNSSSTDAQAIPADKYSFEDNINRLPIFATLAQDSLRL